MLENCISNHLQYLHCIVIANSSSFSPPCKYESTKPKKLFQIKLQRVGAPGVNSFVLEIANVVSTSTVVSRLSVVWSCGVPYFVDQYLFNVRVNKCTPVTCVREYNNLEKTTISQLEGFTFGADSCLKVSCLHKLTSLWISPWNAMLDLSFG